MRPTPKGRTSETVLDAPVPNQVEAVLRNVENGDLVRLARRGQEDVQLEASFMTGRGLDEAASGARFALKARLAVVDGELKSFRAAAREHEGDVPLFVAYGAARRVRRNVGEPVATLPDSVASLFEGSSELVDAKKILEDLDYGAARRSSRRATST